MHPIKRDNMDIQTEVSPQFDSNLATLTILSDIGSNITNICTKNTTSERGKVVWLKNFRAQNFSTVTPFISTQNENLLKKV